MKKMLAVAVLSACLSFVVGVAVADRVHDWHDLDAVHHHVEEAIRELDHARAANHYDWRDMAPRLRNTYMRQSTSYTMPWKLSGRNTKPPNAVALAG